MRVLVVSDIHSNYTALETVIKDAGQVDETWCLGLNRIWPRSQRGR